MVNVIIILLILLLFCCLGYIFWLRRTIYGTITKNSKVTQSKNPRKNLEIQEDDEISFLKSNYDVQTVHSELDVNDKDKSKNNEEIVNEDDADKLFEEDNISSISKL